MPISIPRLYGFWSSTNLSRKPMGIESWHQTTVVAGASFQRNAVVSIDGKVHPGKAEHRSATILFTKLVECRTPKQTTLFTKLVWAFWRGRIHARR
mgnify:CR=1 FL=1